MPVLDLATYNAKRWIVQLEAAPLASVGRGLGSFRTTKTATARKARLDVTTASSKAYVKRLQASQRAFTSQLVRAFPGVQVQNGYQVVLNGLAVKMSKKQALLVRKLPGVKAVTPDIPFRPSTYATPEQIGAQAIWSQVGGQANAGAGIKVAVIDSGIYVKYDASGNYVGNPCFNDAGYSSPRGYPKGERAFTNDKVIAVFALHAIVPAVCVPCGLPPGPWIGVSLPSVGGSPLRK